MSLLYASTTLKHDGTTSHIDCLTCHIPCAVAEQKYDDARNILGFLQSAQWNGSQVILAHFLGCNTTQSRFPGHFALLHGSTHISRTNGIHADSIRRHFEGQSLSETDYREFRGRVMCQQCGGLLASHRCRVHDAATLTLA